MSVSPNNEGRVKMTEQEQADLLRKEMDRQGVTSPTMRAGIAAIAMGESGFEMKPEVGYANTANIRIRTIFGSRVAALDDAQLDALKADDEQFFNRVYGGDWGRCNLGNTEPDDGYKFRGRGLFQLTGRANYERYGRMVGIDIVDDPEKADTPEAAAAIAVAYMRDRYRGGGWEGMKRAVGNAISDIEATKDRLFQQYLQTGEFASLPARPTTTALNAFDNAVKEMQTLLKQEGLYDGQVDGDFGPASYNAWLEYKRRAA
jgi:putative chitinase